MSQSTTIIVSIITSTVTALLVSAVFLQAQNVFTNQPVVIDHTAIETPAAEQPTDTYSSSQHSVPDVVDQVSTAVVSISISTDVPILESYYEEFNPFGGLFGDGFGFSLPRQRQIGTQRQEIGGGSGFIVSADGFVITNRHVVDDPGVEYTAITNDGSEYDVSIIAKDPTLDIAILKIQADKTFPFLEFASDQSVRLGQTVIAIGNALAEFPNSVSVGVVSGLSRNIVAHDSFGTPETLEGVIQTDAAINQGNSGGPLLNDRGQVIGVNVAVAGEGENIGFALPADSVAKVFESVRETGTIVRPFLGIRYLQITSAVAERNNLPYDYGVLILRGETREDLAVIPGSAADKVGLRENDIILEFAGVQLDGERTLSSLIREYTVGDSVPARVYTAGEEVTLMITLERAPDLTLP